MLSSTAAKTSFSSADRSPSHVVCPTAPTSPSEAPPEAPQPILDLLSRRVYFGIVSKTPRFELFEWNVVCSVLEPLVVCRRTAAAPRTVQGALVARRTRVSSPHDTKHEGHCLNRAVLSLHCDTGQTNTTTQLIALQ